MTTLIRGLRYVFVATPWRQTYLAVYCAFVGAAAESVLIDSDHWRHYFLLLGVTWGLMIASQSYRRRLAPTASGFVSPSPTLAPLPRAA